MARTSPGHVVGLRPRKAARTGVYGGTFNPIHLAHLILAEEVRERFRLGRILFIPSGKPPHKRGHFPEGHQRLEMVRLAIAGNRHFSARDLEVKREGPSFTIETLRTLRRRDRQAKLFFLIGMDAFQEITTWREAERLADFTNFVVFPRPGFPLTRPHPFLPPPWKTGTASGGRGGSVRYRLRGGHSIYMLETKSLPISASSLRRRARQGKSLKYLVPEAVERYIGRHHLYRKPQRGG